MKGKESDEEVMALLVLWDMGENFIALNNSRPNTVLTSSRYNFPLPPATTSMQQPLR